jgi:hypothetical protein
MGRLDLQQRRKLENADRLSEAGLIRLRQLAMFRIRKNFYDERFLSIIDNKRYVALNDARLISDDFFTELFLELSSNERRGFEEWEKNNLLMF